MASSNSQPVGKKPRQTSRLAALIRPDLARLSDEEYAAYRKLCDRLTWRYILLVAVLSLVVTLPVLMRAMAAGNSPHESGYLIEGHPGLVPEWGVYINPVGAGLAMMPNIAGRGFPRMNDDGSFPPGPTFVSLLTAQLIATLWYFLGAVLQFSAILFLPLMLLLRRRLKAAGFPVTQWARVLDLLVFLFLLLIFIGLGTVSLRTLSFFFPMRESAVLGYNVMFYQAEGADAWPGAIYTLPDGWPVVVDATETDLAGIDFTQFGNVPVARPATLRHFTRPDLELCMAGTLRAGEAAGYTSAELAEYPEEIETRLESQRVRYLEAGRDTIDDWIAAYTRLGYTEEQLATLRDKLQSALPNSGVNCYGPMGSFAGDDWPLTVLKAECVQRAFADSGVDLNIPGLEPSWWRDDLGARGNVIASDDPLFPEQFRRVADLLTTATLTAATSRNTVDVALHQAARKADVDEAGVQAIYTTSREMLHETMDDDFHHANWLPVEFRRVRIGGTEYWLAIWLGAADILDIQHGLRRFHRAGPYSDLALYAALAPFQERPMLATVLLDGEGREVLALQAVGTLWRE